jgi:glycine hydroxymethyltransferase
MLNETDQIGDKRFLEILQKEQERQQDQLSLIPSENFFSPAVRRAVGSVFMHKYSEGNIGARYYEGNKYIDELETLTIERAKEAFNLPDDWEVNTQALSGSNANLAVYLALLKPGDTIMGLSLPDGGHLSHGWTSYAKKDETTQDNDPYLFKGGSKRLNISAKMFNSVLYNTDPETNLFNYGEILRLAKKHKPKLIITGGTAYAQEIDYKKMKEIAEEVGAYYLSDIAHEAGLISAGVVDSPIGVADIVTLTTHKTLRSGRGALILGKESLIKKVNKAVLPGLQGGPHNHNIAGICVGLGEALKPEFKKYAEQVIKNAQVLAEELTKRSYQLVTGGTAKHLLLVDLSNRKVFGKKAAKALEVCNIILNMNTMPGDPRPPFNPSAIRLGTPWVTTRGMKEDEMIKIAELIDRVILEAEKHSELKAGEIVNTLELNGIAKRLSEEVAEFCSSFPLKF